MLGSSNQITTLHSHSHSHAVTDCLHESSLTRKEKTGGSSGAGAVPPQEASAQETLSVREFLAGGFQDMIHKAGGLLDGFWNGGQEGDGKGGQAQALWQEGDKEVKAVNGLQAVPMDGRAAGILASAVLQPAEKESSIREERIERGIKRAEGTIRGGLKKGREGMKRFLQYCGEFLDRPRQMWKEEKRKEPSLSKNDTNLEIGDNSYLLDSYNRSGEYSTLSVDRRLEGNFKARG